MGGEDAKIEGESVVEIVHPTWCLSVTTDGDGAGVVAGIVEDQLMEKNIKSFNPDTPTNSYEKCCGEKECKGGATPELTCNKGQEKGAWVCGRDCYKNALSQHKYFLQIIEKGKPTKGQKWDTKLAKRLGVMPEDFDDRANLKVRTNYMNCKIKADLPTFVRIFLPVADPEDEDEQEDVADVLKEALREMRVLPFNKYEDKK